MNQNISTLHGNDKLRVEKDDPIQKRRCKTMSNNSSNHLVVPAAREAMEKFKMEAATEVAVFLTSKNRLS